MIHRGGVQCVGIGLTLLLSVAYTNTLRITMDEPV